MPLKEKDKRIIELATKKGNDADLLLLDAINDISDKLYSLEEQIKRIKSDHTKMYEEHEKMYEEMHAEMEKEVSPDAKIEKIATRLASKLSITAEDVTPTEEKLLELILPLIPQVKDGKTPAREELLALIRPLIPTVENGKDADEEKIIQEVLAKLPAQKETTPIEVRDKLEVLKGDERLDRDAIKGLEEALKEIKEMIPKRGLLGGFGRLGGFSGPMKKIVITGTVNGVNATFTLDKAYSTLMLFWNGQLQESVTHYTQSGKTIVFTSGNIPTSGTLHGMGQV